MAVFKKNNEWWIDYYVNGQRRREKVGPTKTLAENALRKRKVEIAEGKFLDIKKRERIKFEDFAKEFVSVYSKPNKKSWKNDEWNLQLLGRFFNGRNINEITIKDIEIYKSKRCQEVKPATVNRNLTTLKTMFKKAEEWGKIDKNPTKGVKLLREPSGRIRFLEREEIAKLLSVCSKKLRPIVIVALYTGMRRSEILGLKWRDCDFVRNNIRLADSKNGEGREIPMNEQVKTALMRVAKHPESQYIFCDKDGNRIGNVRKTFFTALRKSGIKDFHFHDLRHTFASQLVMASVDINTVRELMGHRDLRMTLRYSHLSPSYKKRAVDILGRRMDTIWSPEQLSEKTKNSEISQVFENKVVI